MTNVRKVVALDDWISQYRQGEEYELLSTCYPYILIIDDMGNAKWEYFDNFLGTVWFVDSRYKYKINWEIL